MPWWNQYIGIAFSEKGRSIGGLDCWGLVQLVYQNELGITLPSYTECYETTNDRDILAEVISAEKDAKWQSPESGSEFDVIILNMRGRPMHVGIVTREGNMIHSVKGIGTVHENYQSIKWKAKVMGFARHGSIKCNS